MDESIYFTLFDELYEKREHEPEEFKQWARAFNALDRGAWADIILDGDIFWTERYQHGAGATDQEYAELIAFCEEEHGYKYLFDVV